MLVVGSGGGAIARSERSRTEGLGYHPASVPDAVVFGGRGVVCSGSET